MAFDLSETKVCDRSTDSVDPFSQGKEKRSFHFEVPAAGSGQANFGLGQSSSA